MSRSSAVTGSPDLTCRLDLRITDEVVVVVEALPDLFGNMVLYGPCVFAGAGNIIEDGSAIHAVKHEVLQYFWGIIADQFQFFGGQVAITSEHRLPTKGFHFILGGNVIGAEQAQRPVRPFHVTGEPENRIRNAR